MSTEVSRLAQAAIALALASSLFGCGMFPQRTEAQKHADREVARRVESALDNDKLLYAKHITVRAEDGVVRLSGYVWDPPDIYEAQRIAQRVDGVTQVVNDLELQRNGIDNAPVAR